MDETLHIAARQTRALHLPAGTQLLLQRGQVLLTEAPRWLGDQLLQLRLTLRAGQSHALGAGGWVQLATPDGPATLRLLQRPS